MSTSRLRFAFVILLCASLSAWAGEITLAVSSKVDVRGSDVDASFTLTNRGTDVAHDVTLSATLVNQTLNAPAVEELAPGKSHTAKLSFLLPEKSKGSFPIYVRIGYRSPGGTSSSTAVLAVARTTDEPSPSLKVSATRGSGKKWGEVSVSLSTQDPRIESATIKCHCPEDLVALPPMRKVQFKDGRASAEFTLKNRSGAPGSRYGVFFVAEYDLDDAHYVADASIALPIERPAPVSLSLWTSWSWPPWHWPPWQQATSGAAFLFLAGLITSFLSRRAKTLMQRASEPGRWPNLTLDILALIGIELFILAQLMPEYLITATTTTGGDTGSHYYTLEYLRHTLLPEGKISSWTPGNYAGFPILQFYFPLPFLTMCLLDLVMPLQVAFKMVSLLGVFLLPVCAYSMLRSLRTPFPGPVIGAALTLPFLFNGANSMWGGNLLSTLAGEYSYSLSMSLSLILLGSLYRGCMDNRRVILNAFLVFLVGFSHGYTLLFVEAMSVFLLITPRDFTRRLVYLGKVYALGFCMLAFWLVPLLAYSKWTTPYHTAWTIYHFYDEVIPQILRPHLYIAGAGAIALLIYGMAKFRAGGAAVLHVLAFLAFGLIVATVMFVAAPRIGVVDIRYVPYAQLIGGLAAALALGWLGRGLHRFGASWGLLILCVVGAMAWTSDKVQPVPGWCKWNYEGFEAKTAWKKFEKINTALHGTFQDPRVVFEHSGAHNSFGTTRAFESLPLFAGRATLEGLYMQASISAPFVFYIQSETSQEKSCPFPQYTYANMDFKRARAHLEMFNVGDLIIRSPEAKKAIAANPDYRKDKTIEDYELWKVTTNTGRYVVPLENEPVLYPTASWKTESHAWFTRDDLLDRHLVFVPEVTPKDRERFKAISSSLDELPKIPIDTRGCEITETIKNEEIIIETNWLNKPLLVKMSYHPNWHVEGADKIYLVSPSFMLIYPQQKHVRLYYGDRLPGNLGKALTLTGLVILLLNVRLGRKGKPTAWALIASRLGIPASLEPRIRWDPSSRARRRILAIILVAAALGGGFVCYRTYTEEPHRLYNRSIRLKDAKRYSEARQGFRTVMETAPESSLAQTSAYYIGICYYLAKDDDGAIAAFEDMFRRYPDSNWTPDGHYHIGICLLRSGREQAGIAQLKLLREKYPASPMARYARDRLREHNALDPADVTKLPDDIGQRMGLAIRLFNEERLDEALPIFEEIYKKHPEYNAAPQAMACAALCHFKQKDWTGTMPPYELLISRHPTNALVPEALYHIGFSLQRLNRKDEAVKMFTRVQAEYPESRFANSAADRLKELDN